MLINADFSLPVCITPDQHRWVASPQPGVERVMLDRVGAEQARATSLVRYAPNSHFPSHMHPGGEEILVLSGTFSDDSGDCPAGWYLRNPPGSSHQPRSLEGATLFVKLWQMEPGEQATVRVDTNLASAWQQSSTEGVGQREVCPLFAAPTEQVCLLRVSAGLMLLPDAIHSAECLVIKGDVQFKGQSCEAGSWLRLPAGCYPQLLAGPEGATVYLKTGHMPSGRVAVGQVAASAGAAA